MEAGTKVTTRAEIARQLKIKIEALCMAAVEPELERTEHGNYHPFNTAPIALCAEEALDLVDRLAGEDE